jgi:hypothetical protein
MLAERAGELVHGVLLRSLEHDRPCVVAQLHVQRDRRQGLFFASDSLTML